MKIGRKTIYGVLLLVGAVLCGLMFLAGPPRQRPDATLLLAVVMTDGQRHLQVVITNVATTIDGSGLDYPEMLPPFRGSWLLGSQQVSFSTANYPFTAGWTRRKGESFQKVIEVPAGATEVTVEFVYSRVSKLRAVRNWLGSNGLGWLRRITRNLGPEEKDRKLSQSLKLDSSP